jgi:hypothetical protein
MTFSRLRQHPLTHIAEHVFGAVAVFAIALGVAVMTPSLGERSPELADRVPPSEPTLHLAHVLPSAVSLYWDGATDNVGVVAYQLFKNGQLLAVRSVPSFVDSTNLSPGSLVAYTVAAVDASGNYSVPSQTTYVVVPSSTSTDAALSHELFFSVTPAPVVDCVSGKPMHEVFFAISDIVGGSFLLSSPSNAVAEYEISWGRQQLPNGTYLWKAVPASGYTVSGPASGEFLLSGNCDGAQTQATPGSTAPATATDTPATAPVPATAEIRPTLRFFVDSLPVAPLDYRFSGEDVELRVTAIKVKKVNFYAMKEGETTPIELGIGVYDDLLSMKGTDVWSFNWDTKMIPPGDYRVFARALLLTGSTAETWPSSVRISAPATETPSTGSAKRSAANTSSSADITLQRSVVSMTQVQDPALCTDARSCRAYCALGVAERDQCLLFAQTNLFSTTSARFVSLADGVAPERFSRLLGDLSRRPKDLPDYVHDADDFTVFCRDVSNEELCSRVLERSDLVSSEELGQRRAALRTEAGLIQQVFDERTGVRSYIDTDGDHVSDYDELNIYGTDPNSEDSDGDGFLDGEEIVVHTDPLGGLARTRAVSSTSRERASEEVSVEDVRLAGVPASDILAIRRVTSVEVPGEGTTTRQVLKLSGLAPVNSYVTLYVFSDPVVVTTRATASGTWSYLLPHDLPDGSHQAILGIADAQGRVLARSTPLWFVKEGPAIMLGSMPEASAPSALPYSNIITALALLLAALGVGLSFAGLFVHRKHLHEAARVVLPRTR